LNNPFPARSRSDGRGLFGLLAIAILVWLASAVVLIVWFFSTNTRDLGLGAVAVPFSMLGIGYMIGGGAIFAIGSLQVLRRRLMAKTVGWAVVIYVAPAALMASWAALIPGLAPLNAGESDLGGMLSAVAFPIALLLLAVGLVVGRSRMRRQGSAGELALVILLPLLVGALGFGLWQGWRQLSSPEAQGRGALQFSIEDGRWANGGLSLDATLELSRDAAYQYHAIYLEERSGTTGGRVDEIQWADGTPPVRRGRYRCRLLWRSLATDSSARNRLVIFDVRAPNDRAGYGRRVAEFRVPLDQILASDAIPSR